MCWRLSSGARVALALALTTLAEMCHPIRIGILEVVKELPFSGRRLALVGFLALLPACGDPPAESPREPGEHVVPNDAQVFGVIQPPPLVEERLQLELVAPRVIERVVVAPGEVELDLKRVAKVTSRIEGQVERVHVQLGDHVRTGQALVAIGSLELDELVQEYLVSKAQTAVAEDNLNRIRRLRADKIIPERQLVEARGHHLETRTRYEHVREKLLNMAFTGEELRELEQGDHVEGHLYVLKALLSGRVVHQNVVLGQGVSPGVDLLEVVDTSQVWVFASLPIEEARHFKEGDTGTIVPRGGEPFEALLAYVAPLADEKTRTVRVRFDVPNQDGRLRPHEYVDVRLTLQGSPTLAVPASAVTQVDGIRGVFVRRGTAYEFVPIQAGRESGSWVEITSGLTAGEHVAKAGVFDLKSVLLKARIEGG